MGRFEEPSPFQEAPVEGMRKGMSRDGGLSTIKHAVGRDAECKTENARAAMSGEEKEGEVQLFRSSTSLAVTALSFFDFFHRLSFIPFVPPSPPPGKSSTLTNEI